METLKTVLASPPVLEFSHFGVHLTFYEGACNIQIGSVLLQKKQNDTTKSIRYWSCFLAKTEQQYDSRQRDRLANIWFVLLLRPYLENWRFPINADHNLLKIIFNFTDSKEKLPRWPFTN